MAGTTPRGTPSVPQFTSVAAKQLTVNLAAAALTPTDLTFASFVTLQADPSNGGTIKLGDANGQYWTLNAGDSYPFLLAITNLNLIWAKGSSDSQLLNVIIFK